MSGTQCCLCLWIVHSWLSLRFSLTLYMLWNKMMKNNKYCSCYNLYFTTVLSTDCIIKIKRLLATASCLVIFFGLVMFLSVAFTALAFSTTTWTTVSFAVFMSLTVRRIARWTGWRWTFVVVIFISFLLFTLTATFASAAVGTTSAAVRTTSATIRTTSGGTWSCW